MPKEGRERNLTPRVIQYFTRNAGLPVVLQELSKELDVDAVKVQNIINIMQRKESLPGLEIRVRGQVWCYMPPNGLKKQPAEPLPDPVSGPPAPPASPKAQRRTAKAAQEPEGPVAIKSVVFDEVGTIDTVVNARSMKLRVLRDDSGSLYTLRPLSL